MQSTCLPSIKSLLDSTGIGSLHSYTPSHQTPTPLDPITTSNGTSSYHHISSQSNYVASINTNNPHPSNIKSLLSPPESPDLASSHQQSFIDSYGAQVISQPQQCNCCDNKYSSVYSSTIPLMNNYNQKHSVSNYNNPYLQPVQRYFSLPSTLQPIPIPSYDHKSTLSPHGLPLPTPKHYTQKSQLSQNGSSSGNRYQCPYCSKRFSRPSSLRIHIYSHTGEKPFVCTEPGCGRKFSVQSNMRRHLRVHRLGRPVKKNRYDGEVDGVKIMSPASILQSY